MNLNDIQTQLATQKQLLEKAELDKQTHQKEIERLEKELGEARNPKVTYLGAIYKAKDSFVYVGDHRARYSLKDDTVDAADGKVYPLNMATDGFCASFKVEDQWGITFLLYATGDKHYYDEDKVTLDGEIAVMKHLGFNVFLKVSDLTKADIGASFKVVSSGVNADLCEVGETRTISHLYPTGEAGFVAGYLPVGCGLHADTVLRRI